MCIVNCRAALEERGYYDGSRRISHVGEEGTVSDMFALPVTEVCMKEFSCLQKSQIPFPHPFGGRCCVSLLHLPPSKKTLQSSSRFLLQTSVLKLLENSPYGEKRDEMMESIPTSWERHGDLVMLPSASFCGHLWKSYTNSLPDSEVLRLWIVVAGVLKCKRLVLDGSISCDGFRSSTATLLLGDSGWVDHVDNGIHYIFDVTKCMFSSGNITEKIRLAKFNCRGETVVDLFAGIGYFVLPYLVHAGAQLVHACEWNPHSVEGLKRSLRANRVEERCVVHFGDNKKVKNDLMQKSWGPIF